MPTTLRAEIKQTRPFRTLEQEAALSIARTAAVLEHEITEGLRARGLTPTQYNALRILRGAGAAGLCRNEVRDRLIARVPDATRLLDRLEAMRLVEREREGDDRRFVTTRVTAAGLALLKELEEPVIGIHQGQLGHLGRRKLRMLIALLAEARDRG